MTRTICILATTLLLVLTLTATLTPALRAQSQSASGTLEGTITASDQSALPGVALSARNTGTNLTRTAMTNATGRYRVVGLPPGAYEVTATLDGFQPQRRSDVRVTVSAIVTANFQLSLSEISEVIDVTADTPLIETSSTRDTVTIDRETLDEIPNNNRNYLDFTLLTPGASLVQGPDGDELTINGQKGIQNNISVDGADFNNPFFGEQRGGQRPAFTFNIDAVQEFVVIADGAPAEFGRSSGGFVNVVTKSGTNAIAGTVHAFFKNDSLSSRAERADGTLEPDFNADQVQAGFTLGGPIRTDKLFYFLAVDFQNADRTKQNDPNRIPAPVVDALAALGSPNENAPITRTDDGLVGLFKLDWQLNEHNIGTFRYTGIDSEQVNGTFDVDSWGTSANATEKDSSNAGNLSLTSNLSDSMINEARVQFAREDRPRPYEGPTLTGTDRPLPDIAFDFGRQFRFGMPFFIPVEYHDTRWQLNDAATKLVGDHTFKAGVEWTQTAAHQTFIGFANGRFVFGSTEGFLNYASNPNYVECSDGSSSGSGTCPAGTSITGPVLLYLQQAGVGGLSVEEAGTQTITQTEPSVYFQDTWQPRSNLTFTYGLRWEAQLEPDLITPRSELFYAPFIGQTRNGQEFPGDGTIPDDKNMFQPRVGVAWDPKGDGKQVLRFNFGTYNARVPGLVLASSRSTDGSRGQTLFRNSAASPFLGPPPPIQELIPVDASAVPFQPGVFVFDKDFQNPTTQAFALSWEGEVVRNTSVHVKANFSKTDHLTRFTDRNDPALGSPWATGLGPDGTNGIGVLTTVESTARSRYRGVTVGVTHHSRTLDVQANYTNSRDKSDDDNERDPFTFRYADITRLDAEYGLSDRDQRHRFNAWLLYRAPFGFNINARYSYRSPQPISITESGALANTPQDRINADGTITRRNLGQRDNLFKTLDLRLSKVFELGDKQVELTLDAFNILNDRNLLRPQTTNLVFNFDGTVSAGTGEPREFQLGVRFRF